MEIQELLSQTKLQMERNIMMKDSTPKYFNDDGT